MRSLFSVIFHFLLQLHHLLLIFLIEILFGFTLRFSNFFIMDSQYILNFSFALFRYHSFTTLSVFLESRTNTVKNFHFNLTHSFSSVFSTFKIYCFQRYKKVSQEVYFLGVNFGWKSLKKIICLIIQGAFFLTLSKMESNLILSGALTITSISGVTSIARVFLSNCKSVNSITLVQKLIFCNVNILSLLFI